MGENEGNPYIVMQFLEGESLQELIDQQRDLPLLLRIGYCFEVTGGDLFAFAGLWDGWKDANGNWVKTCSILTTTPNAVTSAIHDRMLVILHPDSYDLWLDPGMQNVAAMAELLKPYYGRQMRCYPVSSRVNHVGNDDEECSRPLDITEAQNRLFA
jgi:putative SOS response-associated peptidase YedK